MSSKPLMSSGSLLAIRAEIKRIERAKKRAAGIKLGRPKKQAAK